MKTPVKVKKKRPAVRRSRVTVRNLDERLDLLTKNIDKSYRQSLADRDRLSRLEKEFAEESKESRGHRKRMSRALENIFANSLPRIMRRIHNIVIRPKDIRMRARKNNRSREFDFIAPNGKLTLVGEVKTHLTEKDVVGFSEALMADFRKMFPEYDGRPIYGVVAGVEIDDKAAEHARRRGFYILRIEGSNLHPDTDPDLAENFRPQPY